MEVAFAVVGGKGIDSAAMVEGVQAFAVRADVDEVGAMAADDVPAVAFDLRFGAPSMLGDSAYCDVEVPGADGLRLLIEAGRTVAARIDRTVRVLASVRGQTNGGEVTVGAHAVDVAPSGTTTEVSLASAPAPGRVAVADAPQRLAAILDALVVESFGDGARARSDAPARAFRRTPLFESVRLNRLARTMLAAKSVVFAPEDPSGNVRVRIDAPDGARQISIVTTEEAAALRRLIGSSST